MRSIDSWLVEYGESHQNRTNKIIHWICVPVIAFTVVAGLWSIPAPFLTNISPWLNFATLALGAALVYYLLLSPPIFVGMLFFSALCVWLAAELSSSLPFPLWQLAAVLFVAAWIGQFIGHAIEGRKPSFFKDLVFLLIGPAWLMHFILKKMGIRYS